MESLMRVKEFLRSQLLPLLNQKGIFRTSADMMGVLERGTGSQPFTVTKANETQQCRSVKLERNIHLKQLISFDLRTSFGNNYSLVPEFEYKNYKEYDD